MSSSNKTKRRHSNKHKHTKRHRHRHNKSHKHKMHSKRRLYRKTREIRLLPGSKSVPLFAAPEKKRNTSILENNDQVQGNIVQGLRSYLNHKI
jgi:hypothetical protein